jgi:hypothetical protein
MTGTELREFFNTLIDDETLDDTAFYTLLNVAKDKLEEERNWSFLKAKNASLTASPGETYQTMKALPTDFRNMLKIYIDDLEYTGVPYEYQIEYKDSDRHYYIDFANNQFAIIGQPAEAKTINLFYLKTTADLTSSTEPVFPSRFHKILAYLVAGYYTAGIDADDIYARMSAEHKIAAKELKNAMVRWDNKIILAGMDYSAVRDMGSISKTNSINIYE